MCESDRRFAGWRRTVANHPPSTAPQAWGGCRAPARQVGSLRVRDLPERILAPQNRKHGLCSGIGIAIDVAVPQPHDPISFSPKMLVSSCIPHPPKRLAVLTAIDFD